LPAKITTNEYTHIAAICTTFFGAYSSTIIPTNIPTIDLANWSTVQSTICDSVYHSIKQVIISTHHTTHFAANLFANI
jgi:hypothetical protein